MVKDASFGSLSASVLFDKRGQRCTLYSRTGHEQTMIIVNTLTERTIGFIHVTKGGAIEVLNTPNFVVQWPLPEYYREATTMVIGIAGPFTLNIRDCLGDDEDILRLKAGKEAIFIPQRYMKPTVEYDRESAPYNETPVELANPNRRLSTPTVRPIAGTSGATASTTKITGASIVKTLKVAVALQQPVSSSESEHSSDDEMASAVGEPNVGPSSTAQPPAPTQKVVIDSDEEK